MSGIVAIVNFDGAPVDPQVLKKMAEQCAYRGPDGIHYWIQGNVGLAHLALHATPEALRERQPQLSKDGQLCLTADARVDNRPELIHLLNTHGEPVTTEATDADLILASYRVWGEKCPEQIIGDYAFAIWDAKEQRLVCARDIYGVKSLHYARAGSTLCVASEAQQIIQHPKMPPRLDEVAVADFLVENFNDEGRSMFQDVWAVRRAHFLVADAAGQRMERYWDIDPAKRITYASDEEYAAHFLELFQRAVSDRLRTPGGTIGITMSGGMDSTSIAAVAQKLIQGQGGRPPLLACSYAFDTLKECDETQYSQAMRDELGIELVYIPAENYWFLDNDENYTPSLETPFLTANESLTQRMLGIFAEREARVWFTGHGGDSLLLGCPLYFADRLQQGDLSVFLEVTHFWREQAVPVHFLFRLFWEWCLLPLIPEALRKIKRGLMKPGKKQVPDWLEANFARRTHIPEHLADLQLAQRYREHARQTNYISAVQIDPIQQTLAWAERIGAHFKLEARHPFLDRRLTEFLMAIPPEQLYRDGWQKFILRKATHGILPDIIRTRPGKTEFSSYVGLGLRKKETGKIRGLIRSPLLSELSLVYLSKLQSSYERCVLEGNTPDIRKNLCSISLELWLMKYYPLF